MQFEEEDGDGERVFDRSGNNRDPINTLVRSLLLNSIQFSLL